MIERWWFLIPSLFCAAIMFYFLTKRGIAALQVMRHPLAELIITRLPRRGLVNDPQYFFLAAALISLILAGSGVRYGTKIFAEFYEARRIGLLIDQSGSIDAVQASVFTEATKDFFGKFKDSAAVTIAPFADSALPSPLFSLSLPRQYAQAVYFLENREKIDVGSGTEGGVALYATFEKLMVPDVISAEFARQKIAPWLKRGEITSHEKELRCQVKDRAIIMQTDADFSENNFPSVNALELYRLCGIRVYLISINGKQPPYLKKAVEATHGKFLYVNEETAKNPVELGNALKGAYDDILSVERSKVRIRQTVRKTPVSRYFAAAALIFGALGGIAAALNKRRTQ